MDNISLLVAFGAGVVSFLSPCVLPLVPAYMGQLAGVQVLDRGAGGGRWATLPHSVSFVLGFGAVFVAMGMAVGLLGVYLAGYMGLLRQVAGAVLVALGLHLAGVLRLPFLYRERRWQFTAGNSPGYLRSFLLGSTFSVGWTPCVGPILGGILALSWTFDTAWHGAYLLAAYSLGLGLPFIAMGMGLGWLRPQLQRLNRHLRIVSVIGGVIMIAMGVLVFTNKFVLLNRYFDWFNLGQGV